MRTRISIIIGGVLTALALVVAVSPASAATNIHNATLAGSAAYPAANGKAKYSVDDGVRELEAQVEDVKALAGQRVRFLVNGNLIGAATVNSFGDVRLRRTGSVVPTVTAGSPIRVRTTTGVLVASGRFS